MHATVRAYANATGADVRMAVQTLRCSLGPEELWEERVSKTLLVAAAARIGIRTPWARRVQATRMKGAEIKEFDSLLPLVIKSDRDGSGAGVRICHDRTCLKLALKRNAKVGERSIQQYVSGPTLAYDGTALDGQILGGFARAELLSIGRRGFGFLLQTIDAPEVAAMAAKLVAHLRYTGYFNLDWIVDSESGLPYLIDTNMRSSPGMSHDGAVLGMGDSPLARLRQAVSGEVPLAHFAASWYTPLAHSIVSLTLFGHSAEPPSDLMYCPSVYSSFPAEMAEYVSMMHQGTARLDTDGRCSYENLRHQPGLPIQPMCGRRNASVCAQPPACQPLVSSWPVPTILDVATTLCDPERNWRKFAHCVGRRRAGGQQAPVPYDDGYWDRVGLTLCRDMRKQNHSSVLSH
ncbi:hypothetical protein T492DRAFT_835757 [Pavlovales sp. CCMP2436]|nr:hypothetical protein T492DRAFT_835757 [Pavlovales sp. CCMP2436]